jgi:hypothetical protein
MILDLSELSWFDPQTNWIAERSTTIPNPSEVVE